MNPSIRATRDRDPGCRLTVEAFVLFLTPGAAAARIAHTVGPVVIRGYRAVVPRGVDNESDSVFQRHPCWVILPEVGGRQLEAIVADIEIPADLVGVFQDFRVVPTDAIRPHSGQKVAS